MEFFIPFHPFSKGTHTHGHAWCSFTWTTKWNFCKIFGKIFILIFVWKKSLAVCLNRKFRNKILKTYSRLKNTIDLPNLSFKSCERFWKPKPIPKVTPVSTIMIANDTRAIFFSKILYQHSHAQIFIEKNKQKIILILTWFYFLS